MDLLPASQQQQSALREAAAEVKVLDLIVASHCVSISGGGRDFAHMASFYLDLSP